MTNQTEADIVNRLNIEALNQAVKDDRKRVDILVKRLDATNQLLQQINTDNQQLRQQLVAMVNMR